MTHHARLSIAIPTYKRPEQLRACVESILVSARPHGVPIVISDDSGDQTNQTCLTALQESYPHLFVHRNEKNIGIDRNILRSVDLCETDYVWLIGEDDRMVADAIPRMLESLRTYPHAPFLFVNYSAVDDQVEFYLRKQSIPLEGDQVVNAETFYRHYTWSMGFIGACVIQKHAWEQIDPTPYLGTYYAHVGRIMEAIQGQEVPMIADALVLNRCGTPEAFTWSDDATGVLTGWGKMIAALQGTFSAEADRDATDGYARAHGIGSLKLLAYLRAGGAYDLAVYRQMNPQSLGGHFRMIGAWGIAVLPRLPFLLLQRTLMWNRKRTSPALPVSTAP